MKTILIDWETMTKEEIEEGKKLLMEDIELLKKQHSQKSRTANKDHWGGLGNKNNPEKI